ncbi:MAG: hypothetical protein M1823_003415 [Watsoniomyces obsoletus]|nr:MAG: hypothetical protein M1823_003415 [Watsoniomyces obsoletus]
MEKYAQKQLPPLPSTQVMLSEANDSISKMLEDLKRENELVELRKENEKLRKENERLRKENETVGKKYETVRHQARFYDQTYEPAKEMCAVLQSSRRSARRFRRCQMKAEQDWQAFLNKG